MEAVAVFGERLDGVQYSIRPGVYAILFDDMKENVALVRTSTGYFLPGGGIEGHENHEECIVRECKEEIGIRIQIEKYIGRADHYFYSTTMNCYMLSEGYFYLAEKIGESSLPTEDDHVLVWTDPEAACKLLMHEHQKWAVLQVASG